MELKVIRMDKESKSEKIKKELELRDLEVYMEAIYVVGNNGSVWKNRLIAENKKSCL